jgi:hypothetical protein
VNVSIDEELEPGWSLNMKAKYNFVTYPIFMDIVVACVKKSDQNINI